MKKSIIKLISVALASTFVFGFTAAKNVETWAQDMYGYYYDEDTECSYRLNITQETAIFDRAPYECDQIEIPEEITVDSVTYTVNAIDEGALSGCECLKKIVIPSSVISIGANAFDNCENLKEIGIPNSVTSIGDYAFNSCKNLKEIEIPSSVTSIGDYAFSNCAALEKIVISDGVTSISDDMFWQCTNLKNVIFVGENNIKTIGKNAFNSCKALEEIAIPNEVQIIDETAFGECTNLTSVIFGVNSALETIGDYAFSGCSSLKNISIPNNVTKIGQYAFTECKALEGITIPSGVKSIENGVFSKCVGLLNVKMDDETQIETIGDSAFNRCESLTGINIPQSVTSIGAKAFDSCKGLTGISIPASVKSIGESGFSACTNLNNLDFKGNSLKTIGKSAFKYCPIENKITIPESVTSIGESAFEQCKYLETIEIPANVETMGDKMFFQCSNLKNVTAPLSKLGNDVFGYCNLLATFYILETDAESLNSMTEEVLKGKFNNKTDITLYYKPTATGFTTPKWKGYDCYHFGAIDISNHNDLTIKLSETSYTYDGQEKQPVVTVIDGATILVADTDYEVTYEDNINAGTATVYVKGKGGYTGIKSTTFEIKPGSLDSLTLNEASYTYTGTKREPGVTVKAKENGVDKVLVNGKDYTVDYKNNINAGPGTVIVTGKGNYTGSKSTKFEINPVSLDSVVSNVDSYVYTGLERQPSVTVKAKVNGIDNVLKNGTDYTVAYKNNTNVGTATVTVTGKGNYTGTKSATFKINAVSLNSVALSATSYTYTGTARKPSVAVKAKVNGTDKALKNGTDYTVAYKNNINAGTATVTVTGKGNYTGTKSVTFKISPVKIVTVSLGNTAYTYSGAARKPSVTVKAKVNGAGKTLKNGTDYTVTYKNNTNVGTATVTVKAKGNYTGTISKTFKINPKSTSFISVQAAVGKFTAKWKKQGVQTSGYQLQYSTNKNFASGNKTITITNLNTVVKDVGNLVKGKTYYTRIRTFKTVGSTKYYSAWSGVRAVTTKK